MSDGAWVMSDEDFDVLRRLRESGIKSAKLPIGEFEFFPPGVVAAVETGESAPKTLSLGEPEACRCGHDETEHAGDGYCLRGCGGDKCIEAKANA